MKAKRFITGLFLSGVSLSFQGFAQTNISVNVSSTLSDVSSNPLGINMDYLMDGTFITPAPTTSTTAALSNMGVKFMRFPGGEKADNYLWSVPPFTSSNPHFARTGPCEWPSNDPRFAQSDNATVKPTGLDFDEFMTMCTSVGGEPLIVVAYDAMYKPASCGTIPTKQQLITTAVEWVRYANIVKGYNIKYWMIGNESYKSCDYNGCATAAQYRDDIIQFAQAMKTVDPTIKIIINGESNSWWQTILPSVSQYIDILGVSNYPVWQYTGGYDYYKNNTPNLMGNANIALNAINSYAPTAHKARLKVMSTEFNSMDWQGSWPDLNDVGHALVNFEMIGEHLKNPKIEGAMLWNTRWVNNLTKPNDLYDAIDRNGNLLANGKALSIWTKNLLPKMVATTSTTKIRSFASYNPTTMELNVFLINKETSAQNVTVNFQNYIQSASMETWEYKGSGPSDVSPTWTTQGVRNLLSTNASFNLSPVSVTMIKLKKKRIGISRPIWLTAFRPTTERETVLTWTTETPNANGSFTIERSENGIDFTPIANVLFKAAKGSQEYTYKDEDATASAVYRLQVDNDGETSYSGVATVNEQVTISDINVYPNPARDVVKMRLYPLVNMPVKVNAFSLDGKLVESRTIDSESGIVNMNVDTWAKGVYILKLKAGEKEFHEKLVIE